MFNLILLIMKKIKKSLQSIKDEMFQRLSPDKAAKIIGGTNVYTGTGGTRRLDTADC